MPHLTEARPTVPDAVGDSLKITLNVDADDDDGERVAVEVVVARVDAAADLLEARPRLARWTRVPLRTAEGIEVWLPPQIRVR